MSNDFFEESQAGSQQEVGGMPAGILDMDALFEQAVNQDEVRQVQADSLKPVGSYLTVPNLTVQAQRVQQGPNTGRLMFRFFGPAVMTVTEKNSPALKLPVGTEVRGQFGFGISPERANKIKDGVATAEPDHSSKLWAQAVAAYEVATKAKAGTIGDVVRYLQNYPAVIRVIQVGVATESRPDPDGEPGNIVMGISPVREARG